MKREFLYCVSGPMQFVVNRDEIISRSGFSVSATEVFAITFIPSNVSQISGVPKLTFDVRTLKNVHLNCSLICDLQEDDPLYQAINESLESKKGKN
jgi:hypothetical protein